MRSISIYNLSFDIAAPYAPGQPIGEPEANALNQYRAEGIANNVRAKIKALFPEKAEGQEDYTAGQLAAVLALATPIVTAYDAEYVLTVASVAAARVSLSPIEKEARSIAKSMITASLKAKGKAVKDVDAEKLAAKIAEVAATEQVMNAAKKAIAARTKATETELDLEF